jgi:NAD(P)-dependent dehydrogenase (short-subunit alcohol dehydrogenase family)
VGPTQPIHLLINNAGVAKKCPIDEITMDDMLLHFQTNTFAPVLITKVLRPHLALAATQCGSFSQVINISSILASNTTAMDMLKGYGVAPAYFASKTALNMFSQCMANDLKKDNIAVGSVHPGIVLTDMNPRGIIQPEESVDGMVKMFGDINLETSGSFRSYTGEVLPW